MGNNTIGVNIYTVHVYMCYWVCDIVNCSKCASYSYHCITVSLYHCITVSLYHCITVSLYHCITVSLSSLFLAGSLWVFYLSLRLLFVSPKSRSKFISPIGLKVVAMVFAVIPIVSIIIGTFWEKPLVHSTMTIAYIGIVFRLWGMSNHRGQNA